MYTSNRCWKIAVRLGLIVAIAAGLAYLFFLKQKDSDDD